MSTSAARAAVVSTKEYVRDVHVQLSKVQEAIDSLRAPLLRAEDGIQTVARQLELPAIALNPFNFAFTDIDLELTTHGGLSQLTIPLARPEKRLENNGEEASKLFNELRNCVIVYGVEGEQGMCDFYVVCGAPLLAEYRQVEIDEDAFAFLQRKSIRPIPSSSS